MIRDDVLNFQEQLVHLFRVFEVDVSVSLQRVDNKDEDGFGVVLTSIDPQVEVVAGKVSKKTKKKDVLSG